MIALIKNIGSVHVKYYVSFKAGVNVQEDR